MTERRNGPADRRDFPRRDGEDRRSGQDRRQYPRVGCPVCGGFYSDVKDPPEAQDGDGYQRLRLCECGQRYYTRERFDRLAP